MPQKTKNNAPEKRKVSQLRINAETDPGQRQANPQTDISAAKKRKAKRVITERPEPKPAPAREPRLRKPAVPSLAYLFQYHNDQAKALLAPRTLIHYYVTQRYLLNFFKENYGQTDILLHQIDYQAIADFEAFLYLIEPKDHRRPLQTNGVHKHLTRVKKMLNLAYNLHWITASPFRGFKMRKKEVDKDWLTPLELRQIETQQISIARLLAVRDMFIFSCYTGLAFVDMANLKAEHIVTGIDGGLWIKSHRQKTDTPVSTPLLPAALTIMERYQKNTDPRKARGIFPVISNQKMNAYLKEIAMICGIKKNITYHIARHTFATTVTLSNGVPIETVSKMLGHTKLATTQIYARVLDDKISRDMKALRKKLDGTC